MTVDEFRASATAGDAMPEDLSPELQALWHAQAGHWDTAHSIAQEIPTATGSWIHALLHLIEGDPGNAGYWFRRAGRPVRPASQIEDLWAEIAGELLSGT